MTDPSSKCINHAQGPDGRCIVCSMLNPVAAVGRVIHACPPNGSSLTLCCQQMVHDLSRSDRMTLDPAMVSCPEYDPPAGTPATVATVPRPRGELTPTRARRLAHLVKARSDVEADLRIEALLALTEDGASFREVSELTAISTNTLQRWKREAQM